MSEWDLIQVVGVAPALYRYKLKGKRHYQVAEWCFWDKRGQIHIFDSIVVYYNRRRIREFKTKEELNNFLKERKLPPLL